MNTARALWSFPWRWGVGAFLRWVGRAAAEAKQRRVRMLCEQIATFERGRRSP